jgi:hypothetical protein
MRIELSLWKLLAKIDRLYIIKGNEGDLNLDQIKELRDMGLIYINMVTSTEGLFYLYMLTVLGKETLKNNQLEFNYEG